MPTRAAESVTDRLIASLAELREQMLLHESRHRTEVERVRAGQASSARNFLHYLALRQHDLRPLQQELERLGLSSLGRSEAHALATVESVLDALQGLGSHRLSRDPRTEPPVDFASGHELLGKHAAALLGPAPPGRGVRIMVTMPSEAAEDYGLVRDLVSAGMDVMRINAAHDEPPAWRAMARHLEQAGRELRRPTRLQLDLAGPKLRTGALHEIARLTRWRVRRDARGRTLAPARIWLSPTDSPCPSSRPGADAVLTVDADLLVRSRSGDVFRVRDTRGHKRSVRVVSIADGGRWGECDQGAFVEAGTPVRLLRDGCTLARGAVGELPPLVEPLLLQPGDLLRLRAPERPGRPARPSAANGTTLPAEIPCTLPEVFADLRANQRVLFDDGKLSSIVRCVDSSGVLVQITHAPPGGGKLGADKGINLPDSELHLPPLTPKDLESLDFGVAHANLIGQSFVRTPQDVQALHAEMARRGGEGLGVLLKIETRAAFDALPSILLAAMCSPPVGVMVARGDLAVEVGYERLAEVQEQILWLCEAAHMPVVWATQVLETMVKTGRASRAEVTDAAMSGRAECVMLNKGPYVGEAVRFLNDVMLRMTLHQQKKSSMLRRLSVSSLSGRFRSGSLRGGAHTVGDRGVVDAS